MTYKTLLLGGSIASMSLMAALPAFAQDPAPRAAPAQAATPAVQEEQSAVDDIVVTGSRIARAGFEAPTPVTVVNSEQLLASQPASLAAAVNTQPALVSTGGPQSGGGSLAHGRNELNARGLGAQRTLILLDGRRFPVSSNLNVVDTNLLPAGLVERVEVVTGGASAAYGSDAVAGVVNFILKTRQDGFSGQVAAGRSHRGDADDFKFVLNWGGSFLEDRLHLLTSFDYADGDGVDSLRRDERRNAVGIISNPAYTVGNTTGQTRLIVAPNARTVATFGGLAVSATGGTAAARAALIGTQFLAGGLTSRYDYGTLTSATNQSGGDGVNTNLSRETFRPLERQNYFVRAIYDLTPDTELFGELQYATSEAASKLGESFFLGTSGLQIRADNAFLPAAVRAQMAAGGITEFRASRFLSEAYPWNYTSQETYRGLVGLKGSFRQFNWEISARCCQSNANLSPLKSRKAMWNSALCPISHSSVIGTSRTLSGGLSGSTIASR
jgi:iron complex outermembrane receptor protein